MLVLLLAYGTGYAQQKKGFILKGKIEGLPDGTSIVLKKKKDTVARCVSVGNQFELKSYVEGEANYYFLALDTAVNKKNSEALWLVNDQMTVTGSLKEWPALALSGSVPQQEYKELLSLYKIAAEKGMENDAIKKFINSHLNSLYVPELIIKSVSLYSKGELDTLFRSLGPAAKNSFYGRRLVFTLKASGSFKQGKIPDFKVAGLNGQELSIHKEVSKSKYTLIDFWASWCSPCRAANPKMLKVYNAFKDRGFNIIGVSTDKNENDWKKAVREDQLPWLQVSDNIEWSSEVLFGIYGIPSMILVDQEGNLIRKDIASSIDSMIKVQQSDNLSLRKDLDEIMRQLLDGYGQQQKTEADYFWDTKPSFQYSTFGYNNELSRMELPFVYSKMSNENYTTEEFKKRYSSMGEAEEAGNDNSNKIFREIQRRYFREWGIQFWHNFPDDRRRFEWLDETMAHSPIYVAKTNDIPRFAHWGYYNKYAPVIDVDGLKRWKQLFQQYKKEYLACNEISDLHKQSFLVFELNSDLQDWRKQSDNDQFDIEGWVDKLIDYKEWSEKHLLGKSNFSMLAYTFERVVINNYFNLGLGDADVKKFVTAIDRLNIAAFQPVFDKYKKPEITNLLARHPLIFGSKSTNGKSVELKEYKGKLVLIDFWSLGCTGCIAAMPELKHIYETYKPYGLEVISACFVEGKKPNGDDWFPNEIERIRYINDTKGGDWSLVLLETDVKERFRKNYKMVGVPQLMLFDEDGKLLHFNGPLKNSLEAVIKDYLISKGKI